MMMKTTQPVIQVKDLRKAYGSIQAVDGVSFEVQRGEIFGIIGPNGAGKTTIVEIMAGLRRQDSGEVRVLGLDPHRRESGLSERTGVQLQQAALPDSMRVWEALDLFASFYRNAPDWRPLLETWGLAEKRDARFSSLSGGQQQRLFIALALVNDPEIVFLDELTTGLDPQARRTTWDLVREIRDQGKTVVLVTHFMDEAEKLCDRVAVIDHGQCIALDTPARLIAGINAGTRVRFTLNGGYHDLSGLQTLPGVERVERENNQVIVHGQDLPGQPTLLLQVAVKLGEAGVVPADLSSERSTLEDVFIAVTGRQIRE